MHRKHLKTALTTALRLCWVAAIIVALCVGSAQADGGLASPFAITSHDPTAHEVSVALDAGIQATFDDDVNMGTVNNYTFAVHGNMGGFLSGSFAYDGPSRTVTLTPGRAFHAGEELRVSATAAVSSGDGTGLTPYGWQFTAGEVFSRPAPKLYDTGASLPNIGWGSAAWGDYDRDGDLDLVLIGWSAAASGRASYVYRNDGGAVFSDISAGLTGVQDGEAVWGDYDRDGDLDILLTGSNGTGVSELYRNNGDHTFTDIGAALGGMGASCAAWGDYDNDGDLDILLAGRTDVSPYRASRVYRNDGSGTFTDIGAALIGVRECSVAWGDLDNDGDLDIALAGLEASYGISKLYRNNGDGTFGDMGAGLQSVVDAALAFGDYDNDGDLDLLLTGNAYYPVGLVSRLYRNNDGDDTFTNIGAGLIGVREGDVAWGDYDNDGDLDILLSGASGEAPTPNPVSRVYRNNSDGTFTNISAGLPGLYASGAAWGDLEGDGDLDILLTGADTDSNPVTGLYRNNSLPALGTVAPSSGSGPVGATTYFTSTWTDPDGWQNLKQCYFHIGTSPVLAGNVTLMYNAAKDKLWLMDDGGANWTGGHAPGTATMLENNQAIVDCSLTTASGFHDGLRVEWAIQFKPAYTGDKKLGLKCKDRHKAKAKGKWKGNWTITP